MSATAPRVGRERLGADIDNRALKHNAREAAKRAPRLTPAERLLADAIMGFCDPATGEGYAKAHMLCERLSILTPLKKAGAKYKRNYDLLRRRLQAIERKVGWFRRVSYGSGDEPTRYRIDFDAVVREAPEERRRAQRKSGGGSTLDCGGRSPTKSGGGSPT